MQLEHSTSSLDTQMAKENAVKQVVTSGKNALSQLSSWIQVNAAKATLLTTLTLTTPAIFSQTTDVAKNDNKPKIENPMNSNTVKTGEEPIKDSAEYKAETQKVSKEWNELKKRIENNNNILDQLEMIQWPINFFKRIEEKQWWVVTERDGKYARAGIAIIDKTEWLPDLKSMAEKARRILVYISSLAPQQAITMN